MNVCWVVFSCCCLLVDVLLFLILFCSWFCFWSNLKYCFGVGRLIWMVVVWLFLLISRLGYSGLFSRVDWVVLGVIWLLFMVLIFELMVFSVRLGLCNSGMFRMLLVELMVDSVCSLLCSVCSWFRLVLVNSLFLGV